MSALRSLEKAKAHVIYIQNDLFLMLERKIFNLPCQHISSGNLFLSLFSVSFETFIYSQQTTLESCGIHDDMYVTE